ncbi:MAG: Membrane-bound lytic murein transglycosylase B precursor (EC [uncultured Sulfurovum sp.]|uniref:Membrane-bound lytic murein transglycosylase B (EC) n=1 Tax=uncultured Sulfurovum sp. TaxID=269237 RepID=A0A6S6UHY5_9BACT|nr:MAG: Membrane-bound lytic murein transglycosylase B precursor (EC [uncultured Sulfurovum sp.]
MRLIFIFLFFMVFIDAKDYTQHSRVQAFIENISQEYKIDKGYLQKLFSNVKVYKTPLKIYALKSKNNTTKVKSAKKKKRTFRHGSWDRYSRLKINPSRVKQGVQFIQKHQKTFNDVEKTYGVPKEYVAAIIGIETVYGGDVGSYLVFDNLVTLAFEKNRRNAFFKKELKKFLLLSQKEKFNPRNVKGSYAGAIGLGQFMPSNYEAYGVDQNKDGRITLQKAEDAIASVANYIKKNGWRTGEYVATRVSYEGKRFRRLKTGYRTLYNRKNLKGITPKKPWAYDGKVRLIKLDKKEYDELWYGAKNFFVITRYNHSSYYAMSVHQLAQKIKKKLDEN